MEYIDDKILNIDDYEEMAKAYASALKQKGFRIVHVDDLEVKEELEGVFNHLFKIKSCLFALGGFLNTSSFYSLNERQIKRIAILFDYQPQNKINHPCRDKTKCLLTFLSEEFLLIKKLIKLSEISNFDKQLKEIINARLSKLHEILALN